LVLYFPASTFAKRNLSANDLEHGRMQVMQMLRDRPVMRTYTDNKGKQKFVTEKDSIWQWVMRKFAGEDLSDTIDWNPVPNDDLVRSVDSYSVYPDEKERGSIWISEEYVQVIDQIGQTMSFDYLWASAVYELINIGYADEFKSLVAEACLGNMSKQEWVERGTKIEFKTTQKMKEFCQEIWLPWAKKNNFIVKTQDGFISFMKVPDSYSEMIKDDKITKSENFKYWADWYDKKILPYRKATGRY